MTKLPAKLRILIISERWAGFLQDRRGVITVIFALCLVPLILLAALAVDLDFYIEARSQIQLAADAAATHAVRAATGTYSLETNEGVAASTASMDAVAAGELAGVDWFSAQLGLLPTASVPTAPAVTVTATSNPAGFSAAVNFAGKYPPFFNGLFHQSAPWSIAGTSGAAAQYSYVEIMMVLDTSQSMDIGADLQDMQTMQNDSVCIPNAELTDTENVGGMWAYSAAPVSDGYDSMYNEDFTKAVSYNAGGNPLNQNGSCNAGTNAFNGGGSVGTLSPCALACHTTTNTYNGQYTDLYGLARREQNPDGTAVKLRIDEVFAATENVIQTMIATEQAADQFSVGLYQFNDDISVLASGTQGNPGGGDFNKEATYNLSSVLSGIEGIDYTKTPAETLFPPVVSPSDNTDYTNFPLSIGDFVRGNATGGVALAPVVSSGSNVPGYTAANPVKDVFIITDGMEDSSSASSSGRLMGEMTGVASENGQTSLAICNKLKALGYTVYVLGISYYPLPNNFYNYLGGGQPSATSFTTIDYPAFAASKVPQSYAEGAAWDDAALGNISPAPNQRAMEACASVNPSASSPTGADPDSNHYFYAATTSAQINTELSAILTSALSSSIHIIQ